MKKILLLLVILLLLLNRSNLIEEDNKNNIYYYYNKKENIINFGNNLSVFLGPIKNNNLYFQNFEIDGNHYYLSFVNKSHLENTNYLYCNKNKSKIDKVYIKKYKNNKLLNTTIINSSGHGQSFLVKDKVIYTTYNSYIYLDKFNNCWAKGRNLISIKNNKKKVFSFKYKNPEISYDKYNNLYALRSNNKVYIYSNKKLVKKITLHNIEKYIKEKVYIQGSVLYKKYFYVIFSSNNTNTYIVIYDMSSNIKRIITYNFKDLGFEVEGIKIYNDKAFIGMTKVKKYSYIYMIS